MPCSLIKTDKLLHISVTVDKQVGRNLHALQVREVRMHGTIQLTHKQRFRITCAESTFRQ